jgi:hypothetical protein
MNVLMKKSSQKHRTVLGEILQRITAAKTKHADRHSVWRQQELQAQGVVKTSELEKVHKNAGEISYITVQVPYSYGMMMSAHTYHCATFLGRDPLFQYEGRHGESQTQELAVESLIKYQYSAGGMQGPLFIWLYDACKYGLGVLGVHWDTEVGYVTQIVEETPEFLGIPIPGAKPKKKKITDRLVSYEGNRVYNVQPQKFFWDPSVTPASLQKGASSASWPKKRRR